MLVQGSRVIMTTNLLLVSLLEDTRFCNDNHDIININVLQIQYIFIYVSMGKL